MPASKDAEDIHISRYQEAQNLYQLGRENEATMILEEIAGEGFAFGQSVLGSMLLFRPDPDPIKAKYWLEKAASSQIPGSFYGLGLISLHGMGVDKSPSDALEYFLHGAKLGDIDSSVTAGELLAAGTVGEARHDLALPAYWQAAEGGSALAQRRLAMYYTEGIEVERDISLALDLYQASSEQGDVYSANNLAIMYERGNGVTKNIDKAIELYTIAAEGGISTARQNLAACLAHPEAKNRDLALAAYWFHKGAESGLKLSMLSLAHIYAHGEGVTQDPIAAEYWRQKAEETIDL